MVKKVWRTDGRTDGQTDGLNQSYSCLVAAKKGHVIHEWHVNHLHKHSDIKAESFPLVKSTAVTVASSPISRNDIVGRLKMPGYERYVYIFNSLAPDGHPFANAECYVITPFGCHLSFCLSLFVRDFTEKRIHKSCWNFHDYVWNRNRKQLIRLWVFRVIIWIWWRHQMDTFSALLALCAGKSPVTGEFPAQRPVTRSFDVFFDLRLNKHLSKQSWDWWFQTPSCILWRHCNGCWALSQYKDGLFRYGISITMIRRSGDRLIFIKRIPILTRQHLYNYAVPRNFFISIFEGVAGVTLL